MHPIGLRVGSIDSCDLRLFVRVNVMFMTVSEPQAHIMYNDEIEDVIHSSISKTNSKDIQDKEKASKLTEKEQPTTGYRAGSRKCTNFSTDHTKGCSFKCSSAYSCSNRQWK
jgi:hypothetical protein